MLILSANLKTTCWPSWRDLPAYVKVNKWSIEFANVKALSHQSRRPLVCQRLRRRNAPVRVALTPTQRHFEKASTRPTRKIMLLSNVCATPEARLNGRIISRWVWEKGEGARKTKESAAFFPTKPIHRCRSQCRWWRNRGRRRQLEWLIK